MFLLKYYRISEVSSWSIKSWAPTYYLTYYEAIPVFSKTLIMELCAVFRCTGLMAHAVCRPAVGWSHSVRESGGWFFTMRTWTRERAKEPTSSER